ncbi:MAG: ABC transporter ATP-binding protein [Ignavibacteriota bacterium]|nr:MAG: ABC transporter ATP-binding protein [Chlorobiota bacterium]MBE7476117.1 ABC transporter ATP-binding protein [Ignavibacteriales bacterium]MBL1124108.1 ABC transporter ATP-binding protein [Ignavibacteriota bacterium]MCE7857196.1 ABC transporter ATP-binding protein [Ignavibacteria bacterium CHB3]QKJ96140.1 MAG: ABC transporter ATP-binding protein [Ignavibacteriota bacterium]
MKVFWRFFKYLKPYIKPLAAANFFMLLFVIFSLASIGLVMPFIDLLFNQSPDKLSTEVSFSIVNIKEWLSYQLNQFVQSYSKIELVTYLCVLIILVFLLKNLFSYLQTWFMSFVEQGIIRDIRLQLYTHFHKLSLGYFTEEKKGILISRIINDVQIIKDSMIAVINSIFRDPPLIIIFSAVLFIFNWQLTLLIFALLPVTGFILAKISDSLKRKSIRSQERIAEITSILDETFGAMRIVKAFGMEQYEVERFREEEKKYFNLLTTLVRRRALASPITETLGVITISIILYFIGSQIVQGKSDMTPGAFFVFLGIFFQMMPSIKLIGQVFNSIQEGIAASERVFSILDTTPKIVDAPNAVELKSFNKKIQFQNVSFKYEKSDLVLSNINVEINKGEVLAIVGPSGAGKSSLVDLIPRFYDVTGGQVLIDDIDIRNISMKSLRSFIGVVTQETILFNDTIRNNIAYGLQDVPMDRIIEAAKAANADNFIQPLKDGYETVIGDRGTKLSGGERQRLSIARALLKNPPILILDEATSSLDTESEVLVQQAIERLMKGRTSIVIAHRLSTIQKANKIIVISDGEIVEEGAHEELLLRNGLYHKLYYMQFKLNEK